MRCINPLYLPLYSVSCNTHAIQSMLYGYTCHTCAYTAEERSTLHHTTHYEQIHAVYYDVRACIGYTDQIHLLYAYTRRLLHSRHVSMTHTRVRCTTHNMEDNIHICICTHTNATTYAPCFSTYSILLASSKNMYRLTSSITCLIYADLGDFRVSPHVLYVL